MDGSSLDGQANKVEPMVVDSEGVNKSPEGVNKSPEGVNNSLPEAEPNSKQEESDSEELKLSDFEDEKVDDDDDDEASRFKLFINNIPPTIEPKTLLEHMSQAGEVVSCWMPEENSTMKRPKVAVITMANEESYKKALALAGTKLEENALKITPYIKGKVIEGRKPANSMWLKNPLVVVLSNISFKTTDDQLKKHFEAAGDIVGVRFPKDRTIHAAFMELRDEESYKKAIAMSNTSLGKHCIKVVATTSKVVPKYWLDMAAQWEAIRKRNQPDSEKVKKVKEAGPVASRDAASARKRRKNNRNLKRSKMRRQQKELEEDLRMMKSNLRLGNVKRRGGNMKSRGSNRNSRGGNMRSIPRGGNMNRAAYDHYATIYGYAGRYDDYWDRISGGSNNYGFGTFQRPSTMLQEAKRKEIEQVALAALTELQARKSGMEGYGFSNSRFGFSDYESRYDDSYRASDPYYY